MDSLDAVSYSLAALCLLGEECTLTLAGFCGLWELPQNMSWDQNKSEGLAQAHSTLEGAFRTKGGLRSSEKPFGESFPKRF